ncbi:hypothetical protein [uncultured Enterococcus sp.]|uniref:hypothetical protein n=1 Tax=uncultured Enterococcus sp. TaxID=167972 RepID=UPI00374A690E
MAHELLDSKPRGKLDHNIRKEVGEGWTSSNEKNGNDYKKSKPDKKDDGYSK